ncbi:zinc-regulated TonB-dependent outer membrane receptor [Hydrogenimonas sp.]|nr:zinc-regulated TonB-dependent outer membrane receptor [Hydrogenimonas sp.]
MKKTFIISMIAAAALYAGGSDMEQLKLQMKNQLQLIEALKQRVEELENRDKKRQSNELKAKMARADTYSASFNQGAFLPDIALVLNSSAVSRNVDNSSYENFAIPGFIPAGDGDLPFNKNRGFNLNYAELSLRSAVDPYFDASAYFHLRPNEFEIGEAYVTTRSLPYSLRIKAGKFKSDFGRINAKHHHSWHFDTQPLVYKAMLGPDGISDPGIQLQWVAPTDTYIMAGIEALQGSNIRSFGDIEKNNLYVGYLKSSTDVGDTTLLGGVSIAHGKNTTGNETDLYGADFTTRTYLNAYSALTWQSELLYRTYDNGTATEDQAGLYSELIYQIDKNYSCGFRYGILFKNSGSLPDDLDRYSVMAEYKPFPMSRLRLQYNRDRSKVIDGERRDIDEIIFSLNVAIGAHGAHAF